MKNQFINPILSSSYVELPQSTLERGQRKDNKTISAGTEKTMILYYFLSFIHHPTRGLKSDVYYRITEKPKISELSLPLQWCFKSDWNIFDWKKVKEKIERIERMMVEASRRVLLSVARTAAMPKLKIKKMKSKKTKM